MSGGRWNYMSYKLEEDAERMRIILEAVASTEHICDWSECGDTSQGEAEKALYDLWVRTFDRIYR